MDRTGYTVVAVMLTAVVIGSLRSEPAEATEPAPMQVELDNGIVLSPVPGGWLASHGLIGSAFVPDCCASHIEEMPGQCLYVEYSCDPWTAIGDPLEIGLDTY